jgi:preprotein translocase subunit YajC
MITLPLQAAAGGFDIKSLMPFALMFIVLYLFMIRPQVKKQKNEKKFQEGIAKGSKVITTSGIHGKVVDIQENTVVIETGAGKIKFEKSSLSMELTKKDAPKSK